MKMMESRFEELLKFLIVLRMDKEGYKECQLGREEIMNIIRKDEIQGILDY